ncbi:thymidine phosphorylase family protein [Phenylobacterium sp.]|uniref:thymidine phosphorylase family protein n=1 Tax=Phenylobacterium sp. TaxID=1871053 RepID=UPI0027355F24|nr:thymidine phosphorylase family protein [Phenylobacterium sp.]MDP3853332.1 thymidine phosphorylase family protein [Phenylobacterium sp.]
MSAEAVISPPTVRARRLGLFTQHDAIVLMREDCHVCRSEGLAARAQVLLAAGGREVLATLYQVGRDLLDQDQAGLSEAAWARLGVEEGAPITVRHAPPLASMSSVRRRIHGHRLDPLSLAAIVADVAAGRYTDVHLAAFLTACSALPLDTAETIALTGAMVEVGDRLAWDAPIVVDKHSVGGLPGNRTTPIVVAIVASYGLLMPKTSSRAITSPAGTADTMETLAPVDLNVANMRRVVEQEGACLVWGGSIRLSPADDVLIRVERVLDIDTEGQLIASVLSKKIAAGSTHVVVDIPVGPTAKVRSDDAGSELASRLAEVATAFGISLRCLVTDGAQPVGRGIGPALEARDVLAVLQNKPEAPSDLRRRACALAGAALELGGAANPGEGLRLAETALADGRAWSKFQRICEAQGGMRSPPTAALARPITAPSAGRIMQINNRTVARLAKLAGAPDDKAAGVDLHVRLGDEVARGQPLVSVHAETPGELDYALDYAAANPEMIELEA